MNEPGDFDFSAEAEQDAAARARAVETEKQEIADITWLMSTVQGRRLMWRLLSQTKVYQQSYVPGDALATAFHEGQRSRGLRLLTIVAKNARADYAAMIQESTHV